MPKKTKNKTETQLSLEDYIARRDFQDVLEAYPSDKSPDLACRAYKRLLSSGKATHEDMLKGAQAARLYYKDTQDRFIPKLSNFLEEGSYRSQSFLSCLDQQERKNKQRVMQSYRDFEGDWPAYKDYLRRFDLCLISDGE